MLTPVAQFTTGIELVGDQQLAGGAIERVAKAVAVEMGQQLAVLTVDLLVGKDHLVDAVIVPFVMGRHLVDPLGHAGIGIACKDGHRPAIVTGPLRRVPGRWVARAVVHEVEVGVVGIPAPGRAAADLPLIALPGVGAGVRADRLAERRRLFRIDQRIGVGTFGIAAPRQLAVLDIVGADPSAHAELAAGDADEHLVLDHHRRIGAGLAFRRIAVLHRPDDRAGLRVERDEGGVSLMKENLAVRVGEAAIDGVAAHHSDDAWILPGLVFPEDLAVVVEVKRKDGIRERRMNIHHVADHQRGAFVTTQNACRKRPHRGDFLDVLGVDLLELGIARIRVILGRHHPLVRVRRQFHQFVVRHRVSGRKRGRNAEAASK